MQSHSISWMVTCWILFTVFPYYALYDGLVAMFELVTALHVSLYFLGYECLPYFHILCATYNTSQFRPSQFLFEAGFESTSWTPDH